MEKQREKLKQKGAAVSEEHADGALGHSCSSLESNTLPPPVSAGTQSHRFTLTYNDGVIFFFP